MLSLRLPVEVENRLMRLAERTGRTKTFYAKEAIMKYLSEMEEIYIALDRLEKPEKRWSLENLESELDLES